MSKVYRLRIGPVSFCIKIAMNILKLLKVEITLDSANA
jgi:hypothetical protein